MTNFFSAYEKSKELLLDMKAGLNGLQQSIENGNNAKGPDINKWIGIIDYAVNYIADLERLTEETRLLRAEVYQIRKAAMICESKLMPFIIVEAQLESGKLEDLLTVVYNKKQKEGKNE